MPGGSVVTGGLGLLLSVPFLENRWKWMPRVSTKKMKVMATNGGVPGLNLKVGAMTVSKLAVEGCDSGSDRDINAGDFRR
jgi:hypothetical protein